MSSFACHPLDNCGSEATMASVSVMNSAMASALVAVLYGGKSEHPIFDNGRI